MRVETYVMLLGAWLALLITVGVMKRHRHKWQAQAVDHGVMNEPRRNATAILYVCSTCGEARATTVAGTYDLQQVCGPRYSRATVKTDERTLRWSAEDREFAKMLKVSL